MPKRPLLHSPARNPQRSVERFIYGVSFLRTGLEKILALDPKQVIKILSGNKKRLDSIHELTLAVRKNVDRALRLLASTMPDQEELLQQTKKSEGKQSAENLVQTLRGGMTAFQNGAKVLFEESRHNILDLLEKKTSLSVLKGRLLSIKGMLRQLNGKIKKR